MYFDWADVVIATRSSKLCKPSDRSVSIHLAGISSRSRIPNAFGFHNFLKSTIIYDKVGTFILHSNQPWHASGFLPHSSLAFQSHFQ